MLAGDSYVVLDTDSSTKGRYTVAPEGAMISGAGDTETIISKVEKLYSRIERVRDHAMLNSAQETRLFYDQINMIIDCQARLNDHLDSLKTASVGSYDTIIKEIEDSIQEIEELISGIQST